MEKTKAKKNSPGKSDTVDRILLALQKSLSRVNRDSATVPHDQARSLITGDVDFRLSCRCDLKSGDKLVLNAAGEITLDLSGHINIDLGTIRLDEDKDAATERKKNKS